MASTMFYIGGITEQAIGKPAPWMVLAVMLFSFAVRSVYMESCSMFVRGGVYVVVRDSMGPTVAKLSVSSLVVDYVLTGPISVVARRTIPGQAAERVQRGVSHQTWQTDPNWFSVFFSVVVTGYFWWQQYQRRAGVQRQGAADYADHHRDGRDPADLVPSDAGAARAAPTAARSRRRRICI